MTTMRAAVVRVIDEPRQLDCIDEALSGHAPARLVFTF
jgi:hypothetical protein